MMPLDAQTNEPPADAGLTAYDILKCMGQAYAGCRTYQDHGTVEASEIPGEQRGPNIGTFSTVFERLGRFRFEYAPGSEDYIVWASGRCVKTYWGKLALHWYLPVSLVLFLLIAAGRLYFFCFAREQALDFALAGATGLSKGSANHIPALLMPEMKRYWRLTSLTDAKRLDDDRLEENRCFCVRGGYAGDKMTLWIDCTTFLVRRIDVQYKSGWKQTTVYYPAVEQVIDAKNFVFRPVARVA